MARRAYRRFSFSQVHEPSRSTSTRSYEWEYLIYAEKAISRQDWEAAYRLLEDGLNHSEKPLRAKSHKLLEQHPKF